ncbi:MAG: RNA polymerase sigma factor [Planctomycetota bacterium]
MSREPDGLAGHAELITQELRTETEEHMDNESRADLCRELLVHYDDIRKALTILVRCPHVGHDLTQEAFRRALRYAKPGEHIRNPRAWLRVIAWNVARDYARQSARRVTTNGSDALVEALEGNGDPVDDLPEWEIEQQELMAAVAALPPIAKALILGYYFDNKGCDTLGVEFGLSREAVKVRLHRARRKLRDRLGRIERSRRE